MTTERPPPPAVASPKVLHPSETPASRLPRDHAGSTGETGLFWSSKNKPEGRLCYVTDTMS